MDSLKRFHVTVVEAKGLKDADWLGKSDPMLALEYGSQKQQTTVKSGTLNPVWNERFTFVREDNSALLLKMSDKDLIGSDPLGDGVLYLDYVFLNELKTKSVERWVELVLRKNPAGSVRLVVEGEFASPTFVPQTTTSHYSTTSDTQHYSPQHTTAQHYSPKMDSYQVQEFTAYTPGALFGPQPVGTYKLRKGRLHNPTWDNAGKTWASEGWSKCMVHETASSNIKEWNLMQAPFDMVLTLLQGEVTYEIKGTNITIGVADELIIPAHTPYHLSCTRYQNAIICFAYRVEGHHTQHISQSPKSHMHTSGVAVRSTIEARNETQARHLDMMDGKLDGMYRGETIHSSGSGQYNKRGTWETSDANMARLVDGLDGRDGSHAGSRVVVSKDGYVDGRV